MPENETTVNLQSASFVVIKHLHEGLTHIQPQIKPRLLSGESFTLRKIFNASSDYLCRKQTEQTNRKDDTLYTVVLCLRVADPATWGPYIPLRAAC